MATTITGTQPQSTRPKNSVPGEAASDGLHVVGYIRARDIQGGESAASANTSSMMLPKITIDKCVDVGELTTAWKTNKIASKSKRHAYLDVRQIDTHRSELPRNGIAGGTSVDASA
ncbi:hypothetical protein M758_1G212800 [Ceratodon purpureus]|nr:hypothetical protein M758_1G212800 [Ceratodon purpureus]